MPKSAINCWRKMCFLPLMLLLLPALFSSLALLPILFSHSHSCCFPPFILWFMCHLLPKRCYCLLFFCQHYGTRMAGLYGNSEVQALDSPKFLSLDIISCLATYKQTTWAFMGSSEHPDSLVCLQLYLWILYKFAVNLLGQGENEIGSVLDIE